MRFFIGKNNYTHRTIIGYNKTMTGLIVASFILTALIAYLIGSLNFSIIIVKAVAKFDIRSKGSKNAGSTNVFRTVGAKVAALTLLLDFAKAIAASGLTVLIFTFLAHSPYKTDLCTFGLCAASLFCVLGHMYPLYFGFKGGKGVATYAGSLMVVHPILVLISLVTFAILVAITKKASLGSILSCITYLIALTVYTAIFKTFGTSFGIEFAISCATAIVIIIKHRSNIVRLIKGEENKLDFSKKHKQNDATADESEATQNGTDNCEKRSGNKTRNINDSADNNDLLNQNNENHSAENKNDLAQKSVETSDIE